jgi:hypothetical protein
MCGPSFSATCCAPIGSVGSGRDKAVLAPTGQLDGDSLDPKAVAHDSSFPSACRIAFVLAWVQDDEEGWLAPQSLHRAVFSFFLITAVLTGHDWIQCWWRRCCHGTRRHILRWHTSKTWFWNRFIGGRTSRGAGLELRQHGTGIITQFVARGGYSDKP